MKFFRITALVCAFILLAALSILYLLKPDNVEVRRVEYKSFTGGRIVGDYYLPLKRKGPLPGVLLCHGVEANKEVMGHLGVEFARRGYAALAFDYGGYGESDDHNDELSLMVMDTLAGLRFLYLQPETQGEGFTALVGHSMGVTYSVETASNVPAISSVVGLGNEAIVKSVPPRNVMLAMGIYDAFHPLSDMLAAVRESSGEPGLNPNEISGDFAEGTARALVTSPYSDHGIEPLDPLLMKKTIEWVAASTPSVSIPELKITETCRAQAEIIAFASGGAALMALLVLFTMPKPGGKPRATPLRSRAYFLIIAGAAIAGNTADPGTTLACADIFLAALISGSIAGSLVRTGLKAQDHDMGIKTARDGLIKGVGFTLLIIVCLLSGLLVNGVPSAYTLDYIGKIPAFLYHILLLRPYEGLCMLRGYAFYRYSEAIIPSVILGIILAAELGRPGISFEFLSRAAGIIIKAFRIKGPFKLQTSRAGVVGAAVAFTGLIFILLRRFQEGWLSGEAASRMFWISMKFMILPLLLFILVINLLPEGNPQSTDKAGD